MLFFTVSQKKIQSGREKGEERKRQSKREIERGRAKHLFDCYLGAILSNYWLEHLKKLITGSHRLQSRQTDLVPGTTQLSAGYLTTTHHFTATSVVPFSKTIHQRVLQLSCLASMVKNCPPGPTLQSFYSFSPSFVSQCSWKKEDVDGETRFWWERKRAGEGADHLFPVFSQLQAWRFYFCWFTAFLNMTTSERGIIRRL